MLTIAWLVRSLHILAGAAWVGGSLMYLLVVIPAFRMVGAPPRLAAQVAQLFKRLVNICVGVLLLSGIYLMVERLSVAQIGLPYLVVLGLKVALALGMFVLALYMAQSSLRRLAKQTSRLSRIAPHLMLIVGILVFILGALLNALFEAAIAPR
jgi:putative copper export protein